MDRELHHQYQQGNRMAKVYLAKNGWEVDLFEGTDFEATTKLHDHSELYAENTAENWVQGMSIPIKNYRKK